VQSFNSRVTHGQPCIHSVQIPDRELHPVTFHSQTLGPAKRNYDMHDKELLAIFEAFKVWHHHLEGSTAPIEVFMDHKNLEYFTSSKMLTHWQAWWSEYLNMFNLSLHFWQGKLGAKPDALTRHWDVYSKEGGVSYAEANPVHYSPQISFTVPPLLLTPVFLHRCLPKPRCACNPSFCLLLPHCSIWKPCIPTY
jgi:hypothetical protein